MIGTEDLPVGCLLTAGLRIAPLPIVRRGPWVADMLALAAGETA